MYHVVLVLISALVLGMGWMLVHSMPSIVARILPNTLSFMLGTFLAVFGAFGGYIQAYFDDARGMIGCFVMIIVGLWFTLAPSSFNRGTYRDTQLMKRIFGVLGLVFAATIAAMYLPEFRTIALANLVLVTGGFWLTTTFLKQADSGH